MSEAAIDREIENAGRNFDAEIHEPDPSAARSTRRKRGSATARKKGTDLLACSLSFAAEEDEDKDGVVQTTQFTTEPDFEGQHVALLLAYDLGEHYEVGAFHSSPTEPTDGGLGLIASLRRRDLMARVETP